MADGRGVWENVEIDANILTTAYGKNRLKEMLLDAAMNDEVLYAEKERSRELAHTLGVQFPDTMANGGFIHSISDYATESNPEEGKYSVNPQPPADGGTVGFYPEIAPKTRRVLGAITFFVNGCDLECA